MEEIGCHFKFEKITGNIYHDTNLLLSSGRNCLRYIIRERNITTIYLPYFLCESLSEVAQSENVKIIYYHLDKNLMPIDIDETKLNDNTYLYFVNYYGLLKDIIPQIISRYKYVILDNTHDFFNKEKYDADAIYNYRKYFGVPDGACIVGNGLELSFSYIRGKSLDKAIEMISRDETGQYFHYPTFLEADKYFRNEELRYMSNFTENYLRAIDYSNAFKARLENYKQLSEMLSKYNQLDLSGKELTFMYPLFVSDGEKLRAYLKANNIYSQKLWPNVSFNGASSEEITIADNMVLLPIDQRYSDREMEYIAAVVNNYYSSNTDKSKILILTDDKTSQ